MRHQAGRRLWQYLVSAAIAELIFMVRELALAQRTTVARVTSAAEFKSAVENQAQHIVLSEHLDLSDQPVTADDSQTLFALQGVQSIRVRFSLWVDVSIDH
jgi:hypothetical protein